MSTAPPTSARTETVAAKPPQDPAPAIKRPLAMNGAAQDYEDMHSRFMALAKVAPGDRIRRSLLRLAEHCEIESRLVERTRTCVSESRELLARVDSLLSPRVAPQKEERNSQGDILRDAMARVFDRWIDQKASPLPRSVALH